MSSYINGPWQWECDDCATVESAPTKREAIDLFKRHLTDNEACVDEAMLLYQQGVTGFQS